MSKNKRELFKKNREMLEIDGEWENIAEEIAKERDSYKKELETLKNMSISGDIIEINPAKCKNWIYSDRNDFELGDIDDLAEDIRINGQLQPAIARKIHDLDYDYEIIAGERRWRACNSAGLNLKAIIVEKNDLECLIIQTSENKKQGLSPYSLAKVYFKLMDQLNISQNELAKRIGMPKASLSNLMSFNKVPQVVWDNVIDMTKVSASTAAYLAVACNKGDIYLDAVIGLSRKIRDGVGADGLEKLVNKVLSNSKSNRNNTVVFKGKNDEPLFRVSSTGRISISKSLLEKVDIDDLGNHLKNYMEEII
tara:strand:- start:45 stop:971 length:927 start_codon:yes stop_codon:yes gene_type:complete